MSHDDAGKDFKAFDKGVLEQVKQAMSMTERVIGRTQLMRSKYAIIGQQAVRILPSYFKS